jgi:phytoene dehydrogenase-like protein
MSKSVIIIGAGIAGLAAGCYAQMNGNDFQIFRLHSLPGGLCTSWLRTGDTFDKGNHVAADIRNGNKIARPG